MNSGGSSFYGIDTGYRSPDSGDGFAGIALLEC